MRFACRGRLSKPYSQLRTGMKGWKVQSHIIDRRKLYEQVAHNLEARILSGEFKPGDRLPTERDLQTQFGVGRPAIREALITLQRAGLIQIGNGMPARVSLPSPAAVLAGLHPTVKQMLMADESQRYFQHVRRFFECGIARDTAKQATPQQVESIRAALARNKEAVGEGDRDKAIETDIAFHTALASVLGNPVITALNEAMAEWLIQLRRVALSAPNQVGRSYREHEAIFRAIEAHDPDAAEEAMRDHLLRGEKVFWQQMATRSAQDN